jgi:hypothetical protein
MQYVILYLDTDANGNDLLDSVGNPIPAGWYRYTWPLQEHGGDPDGPFDTELAAGDGIPL